MYVLLSKVFFLCVERRSIGCFAAFLVVSVTLKDMKMPQHPPHLVAWGAGCGWGGGVFGKLTFNGSSVHRVILTCILCKG